MSFCNQEIHPYTAPQVRTARLWFPNWTRFNINRPVQSYPMTILDPKPTFAPAFTEKAQHDQWPSTGAKLNVFDT
jgi:hypothetical protein